MKEQRDTFNVTNCKIVNIHTGSSSTVVETIQNKTTIPYGMAQIDYNYYAHMGINYFNVRRIVRYLSKYCRIYGIKDIHSLIKDALDLHREVSKLNISIDDVVKRLKLYGSIKEGIKDIESN